MGNKKDPNQKHYFQPATLEEFTQSMQMHCTLEHSPPLTVWEKGEDEEKAEIYEAIEYFPNSKTIKLKPTGKLLTILTGSTKAGKIVLVKIPIEVKINYFTGGLLKFHPDDFSYTIEIQQEIFKSQARGSFRLNASDSIPVQFKIDDQVFDAADISTTGTSFIIDERDRNRFAKGTLFKDCTLRFDRRNYHIPMAQIMAQIPIIDEAGKPTGEYKLGLAFKDLPRKTEDELYVKISTEARGEEMKKKFDSILSKKGE